MWGTLFCSFLVEHPFEIPKNTGFGGKITGFDEIKLKI